MRTHVLGAWTALCALGLLAGRAPAATPDNVPSPANSTWPCAIQIVPAPAESPVGEFEIVARDLARNPISYALVTIDFSGCGDEIRIAAAQRPGATADCFYKTVSARADVAGRVWFRIIGSSNGLPSTLDVPCAEIFIEGVGRVTVAQVAVYDLDGVGGLTANDLSLFLKDYFTRPAPPAYAQRSDLDFYAGGCTRQELSASDLSRWLGLFFSTAGTTVQAPLCTP